MQHFVEEIARLLIQSHLPNIAYNDAIERIHQVSQEIESFRKRESDLSDHVRAALVVYRWYKSYE